MEEIGRRLRAAREAKGVTLEQAEEDTRIRQKYLQALEEAREADLPGEVYLKGFLRSYGNYLGLDGTALVEEYKQLKRGQSAEQVAQSGPAGDAGASAGSRVGGPAPAASEDEWEHTGSRRGREAPARRSRSRGERQAPSDRERPRLYTRPRGRKRAMRRTLTILVICLVLGGAGWAVYDHLHGSTAGGPEDPVKQANAAPSDTKEPSGEQSDVAATQAEETKAEGDKAEAAKPQVTMEQGQDGQVLFHVPAAEVEVRMDFGQGSVWLEAKGDGKTLYSGTLPEGAKDPFTFTGGSVVIDVGHMDGISLTVNGQRFETPLTSGPWELVFQTEAQ